VRLVILPRPMSPAATAADREERRFDTPNFLFYFGAIVAIAATGFFVGLGWERRGATFMFIASLAFLVAYAGASFLLRRRGWVVPGGLFATMAVSVVPLVVYAFQRLTGWWPKDQPRAYESFHQEILASWIVMELITIAVGIVVLYYVRFPLILAPVAWAVWYLSMDLAPLFFGENVTTDERIGVSLVVGLLMIGSGLALDLRGERRIAFWAHFFGLLILLGALCWLTFEHYDRTTWTLITVVSFATCLASIPLQRTTYVVYGSLGLLSTTCYWAFDVFEDSLLFPFVVAVAGVASVALGIAVKRSGARWREHAVARLSRFA
jgi:hypothetical protein